MKRRAVLLVGAIALAVVVFGGVALVDIFTGTTNPRKGTPDSDLESARIGTQ